MDLIRLSSLKKSDKALSDISVHFMKLFEDCRTTLSIPETIFKVMSPILLLSQHS